MTGADRPANSRAMADETLRVTRAGNRAGLILAGEIDESSYSVLAHSLAGLTGDRDVHVDLRGVEFCDVAGLRAIVCLAGPLLADEPARRVILHAVPPQLQKILQVLGWDAMPGVAFAEDGLLADRDGEPT